MKFTVWLVPPARPGVTGPPAVLKLTVPANPKETFEELWKRAEDRFEREYRRRHGMSGTYFSSLQDLQGGEIFMTDKIGDLYDAGRSYEELQLMLRLEWIDRDASIMPGSELRPSGFRKRRLSDLDEEEHRVFKRLRSAEDHHDAPNSSLATSREDNGPDIVQELPQQASADAADANVSVPLVNTETPCVRAVIRPSAGRLRPVRPVVPLPLSQLELRTSVGSSVGHEVDHDDPIQDESDPDDEYEVDPAQEAEMLGALALHSRTLDSSQTDSPRAREISGQSNAFSQISNPKTPRPGASLQKHKKKTGWSDKEDEFIIEGLRQGSATKDILRQLQSHGSDRTLAALKGRLKRNREELQRSASKQTKSAASTISPIRKPATLESVNSTIPELFKGNDDKQRWRDAELRAQLDGCPERVEDVYEELKLDDAVLNAQHHGNLAEVARLREIRAQRESDRLRADALGFASNLPSRRKSRTNSVYESADEEIPRSKPFPTDRNKGSPLRSESDGGSPDEDSEVSIRERPDRARRFSEVHSEDEGQDVTSGAPDRNAVDERVREISETPQLDSTADPRDHSPGPSSRDDEDVGKDVGGDGAMEGGDDDGADGADSEGRDKEEDEDEDESEDEEDEEDEEEDEGGRGQGLEGENKEEGDERKRTENADMSQPDGSSPPKNVTQAPSDRVPATPTIATSSQNVTSSMVSTPLPKPRLLLRRPRRRSIEVPDLPQSQPVPRARPMSAKIAYRERFTNSTWDQDSEDESSE